jgi:hypothetical protein
LEQIRETRTIIWNRFPTSFPSSPPIPFKISFYRLLLSQFFFFPGPDPDNCPNTDIIYNSTTHHTHPSHWSSHKQYLRPPPTLKINYLPYHRRLSLLAYLHCVCLCHLYCFCVVLTFIRYNRYHPDILRIKKLNIVYQVELDLL